MKFITSPMLLLFYSSYSFGIGLFSKCERIGAVYKWEPVLQYSYSFNNYHSINLFITKTYYDWGSVHCKSTRGVRHSNAKWNLGAGVDLFNKNNSTSLIPKGSLFIIYPVGKKHALVVQHDFYYDKPTKTFAWIPNFGYSYYWGSFSIGYAVKKKSTALEHISGFNFRLILTGSYHHSKIMLRK